MSSVERQLSPEEIVALATSEKASELTAEQQSYLAAELKRLLLDTQQPIQKVMSPRDRRIQVLRRERRESRRTTSNIQAFDPKSVNRAHSKADPRTEGHLQELSEAVSISIKVGGGPASMVRLPLTRTLAASIGTH